MFINNDNQGGIFGDARCGQTKKQEAGVSKATGQDSQLCFTSAATAAVIVPFLRSYLAEVLTKKYPDTDRAPLS
ncbi:unnamed protein product [Soboliphyme baturini]|uniref:Uncharacterized protein n=1 Tax=Soboliphyme baturini TaxID=241478 RepID=A0A183IHY9_9BILA|nr:unnamed protein product [Soboliphyme baturini]